MKTTRKFLIGAALASGLSLFGQSAMAQMSVVDWKAIQHHLTQINEMKKQLQEAQKIYNQAKGLHDSLNQITDVKDLAAILNDQSVTQYLPEEYGQFSDSVNGILQDGIQGFADQYDYYERQGASAANDFYQNELKRQKQETYQDMAVGEAIFDTATKRIEGLDKLKEAIGTAETPKKVLDLQARIAAEAALLQNDLLRAQGLAMIQEARNRVDREREAEKRAEMYDQIRAGLEYQN